jgi:hypothetical protein
MSKAVMAFQKALERNSHTASPLWRTCKCFSGLFGEFANPAMHSSHSSRKSIDQFESADLRL